ncbi:putative ABC transport system ATP-binding protein [Glycomyces sambucus]|uniref:Putative ABC transport system ATP-binding protein n=1 Tax=Glycomyces sambucus TaxID=380244 RepID=A0A1G9JD32_9ACTN|nr:ATP-binding cassette domain-containing protein [Glycomyces sambucus]SDL35043.1 putative ABC transport system ATP-binding protein [Glycomyces sambucus]
MTTVLTAPRRPAATGAPALALREISKTYDGAHTVLDRVSLDVPGGAFIAVLGGRGSGKSTLVHCAAGLDDPTGGEVRIGDRRVNGLGEAKRTLLRQGRIGFVFQSFNLLPSLTVEENLAMPLRLAGAADDRDWLHHLAERTGVARLLRRRPGDLAPVFQQRAAVARAFASRPDLVVADEPTGALDAYEAAEVLDLVRSLVDEWAPGLLMVTGDPAAASRAHATFALEGARLRPVLTSAV